MKQICLGFDPVLWPRSDRGFRPSWTTCGSRPSWGIWAIDSPMVFPTQGAHMPIEAKVREGTPTLSLVPWKADNHSCHGNMTEEEAHWLAEWSGSRQIVQNSPPDGQVLKMVATCRPGTSECHSNDDSTAALHRNRSPVSHRPCARVPRGWIVGNTLTSHGFGGQG